jgi:FAD/FMN-containing dehydrogenase
VSGSRVDLIDSLRGTVGDAHVIVEPSLIDPYCTDWTRRFGGPAVCVVWPGSTSEVLSVMRICTDAGLPVLPQGGNTGLGWMA